MKAQRSFTVRPHLPTELAPLDTLAANLRWSWDHPTQELFAAVDPQGWESGRHDPRRVLAEAAPERLAELAADPEYRERLETVAASLADYLQRPLWFHEDPDEVSEGAPATRRTALDGVCVAYFSPEFGISEAIPQYSGGLGVLAGDHVKAASDLGVPLVAVGLYYRHGYFHQTLSIDGWQQEVHDDLDPHALALEACDVQVRLQMAGRPMAVQVWRAQVGRVPLYLLDADVPDNPPELQVVTDRLYGGDTEHRLRQEILLGIGGVKALDALGEPALICHTNEGHAGFLGLERVRMLMEREGLRFAEAMEAVRAGSVFTTHTPVPAGIDRFPRELIEKYFADWAAECGISVDDLMAIGHRRGDAPGDRFNMAVMGMRLAGRRNGVSRLHGSVSRDMFADLWPGVPEYESPIRHITNGVHRATWTAAEVARVLDARDTPADSTGDGERGPDLAALCRAKDGARSRLVDVVRSRMRSSALESGRSPSDLEWIDRALDPDTLTVCFARRMAAHKRAALLLSQPDRLRALLTRAGRPVQFVFAGKAHPADDRGKEMIRQLVTFARDPEVRERFVFVEDHDMALARTLVQGADVWLNTPLRPMEASGTSGMKAVLNGALHCSVLDGWWAECFSPGDDDHPPNGWAITSADGLDDERRSEIEANSLFDLLETQVIPLFGRRDGAGVRTEWAGRMVESLRTLEPFVGAQRMVRDYVRQMYLPAAEDLMALVSDDWAGARELAAFRAKVRRAWGSVRVESVDTEEGVGDLGTERPVVATVHLGDLSPSEVEVQLLVGRVGQSGELEDPIVFAMSAAPGRAGETGRYRGMAPLGVAGRMGVTVRVVPHHPLVGAALDMGQVAWAG